MGIDRERHETGNSSRFLHTDSVLAALAGRQHGVVATRQLLALGVSEDAVRYRARTGHLHRIRRGVYAVGHRELSREGVWLAAVLACAPGAVLSHQTAAVLWGIGGGAPRIHITAPGGRSRGGIRLHRAALHPEDTAVHRSIPVTSVARTIVDLAAAAQDEDRLTRTIEAAVREQLFDLRKLDRTMHRARRGVTRLNRVLADYRRTPDIRSELERDFLALIRKARLPEPDTNVLVAGELVDVHWPHWRLVVELDGRSYHSSPRQFERDRLRDAILQRNGYRVLRITRKRLDDQPRAALEDIRALRRPPG